MTSDVRRAFNQMMAGRVGPFLRGHGFQERKKGHFLRAVDGVGATSLWFQNSNYPGQALLAAHLEYNGALEDGPAGSRRRGGRAS